jgi:hypothetical protein
MSNGINLLDLYHQNVLAHSQQFDPLLAQLRQDVEERLVQLQQQETSLIESQTQILQDLKSTLATDARFVLETPEFQEFVEELAPDILERVKVSGWLLNRSDLALQVMDYKPYIDPDDYDDERAHTSFYYNIKVWLGDLAAEIDRVCERKIYGMNDERIYSQAQQIQDIASEVKYDLLDLRKNPQDRDLAAEISMVIGYARNLLALEPKTVEFGYDLARHNRIANRERL